MSTKISPDDELPDELSQPARRALVEAGYVRMEQLRGLSETDLMHLHGMGPKALDQLRRAMAARGLSLSRVKNQA
jgi:DNA-directed RNA polymerase alpha subunit